MTKQLELTVNHADGCSTNLGIIGAECNCGATAQLQADQQVLDNVKQVIFDEIEEYIWDDDDRTSWADKLKYFRQKWGVK